MCWASPKGPRVPTHLPLQATAAGAGKLGVIGQAKESKWQPIVLPAAQLRNSVKGSLQEE